MNVWVCVYVCVGNKAFKNYGQQATGSEECVENRERDAKQLAVATEKYATKINRLLCECVSE